MVTQRDTALKVVLVVEDDADNRAIYSTLLKHVGYQVIEASDGASALTLVKSWLPQLVLLDISIPRIDGWGVVSSLKEGARTRSIPVIGITGHSQRELRDRAKRMGFAVFLGKPAEPRQVLHHVKQLIGGPHAEPQLRGA